MKEKLALILSTVQTIVLLTILFILLSDRKKDNGPQPIRGQLEAQTKVTKPLKISDTDAIWGKKDAPNTIIAYVDYQCPYCVDVYKNLKEIEEDYITSGKVKIIFRDFPLRMHKSAMPFAKVVECARRQGKFWEMAGLILTAPDKPDSSSIEKWIDDLKLNNSAITACVADSTAEKLIKTDIEEAKTNGVRGTPALFINDVYYRGTLSASNLKDILEGKKIAKKPHSGSCNQK